MGSWTHFNYQPFHPDSSISLYTKLYPRTTYQVIIFNIQKYIEKPINSNFHRTVLLHVERSLFLFAFICLCSFFLINIIRIHSGPLPSAVCWWYKFFLNFGPYGLFFSFCTITFVRVSIIEFLEGTKLFT